MKRRLALKTVATAAITGSAGCTQSSFGSEQYRLWFVRIHNGSASEQRVDIRVRRNGEMVFEHRYENIPSFRDAQDEESSFAAMENARLVKDEWEIRNGIYTIEYRTSGQESFVEVDVGDVDEFEAEDIGVSMQLYGGKRASVAFDVLEFDSEEQATWFVNTVTNQFDK